MYTGKRVQEKKSYRTSYKGWEITRTYSRASLAMTHESIENHTFFVITRRAVWDNPERGVLQRVRRGERKD